MKVLRNIFLILALVTMSSTTLDAAKHNRDLIVPIVPNQADQIFDLSSHPEIVCVVVQYLEGADFASLTLVSKRYAATLSNIPVEWLKCINFLDAITHCSVNLINLFMKHAQQNAGGSEVSALEALKNYTWEDVESISLPKTHGNCLVCYDDNANANVLKLSCGHSSTCMDCLGEHLLAKIRDGFVPGCCEINCQQNIGIGDLMIIIQENNLQTDLEIRRYCDDLCKANNLEETDLLTIYIKRVLSKSPMMRVCPIDDCQHVFLNHNRLRVSNYECPDCHGHYCSHCLVAHSDKFTCMDARIIEDDRQEWLEQSENRILCPNCFAPIERFEGDSSLTCNECQHEFCFSCHDEHPNHQPDCNRSSLAEIQGAIQEEESDCKMC